MGLDARGLHSGRGGCGLREAERALRSECALRAAVARPAPRTHSGRRERLRRPAPAARAGPRAHADRAAGTRLSRRPRHRRTRPPGRRSQAI